MRGIQHHGTFIHHGFEDSFMREESARDERFKFLKFMSPTIGMWAQRKYDPSLSYIDCDEDFQDKSRSWDQTLPQEEFVYNNTVRDSTDVQEEVRLKTKKFNKYKTTTDKKRREKLFKEEYMMMVYLRRERITT